MRINSTIRKHEGKSDTGCGGGVLLVIGGIIVLSLFNSPEGKKLVSATQPPVQVSLTPYMIFDGYYVNVLNTSNSTFIQNVVVTWKPGHTDHRNVATRRNENPRSFRGSMEGDEV